MHRNKRRPMKNEAGQTTLLPQILIVVRPEPHGKYRAQVVGMPATQATASDQQKAIQEVRRKVAESMHTGQLVAVEVIPENPWLTHAGWARDDPECSLYLEELTKARQEDVEETSPGNQSPCSSSPSIPPT